MDEEAVERLRGEIESLHAPRGRASSVQPMRSVAARLRRDERTASIPVLALTAQAMHGDHAGFTGYLSKPVDVAELLRTVAEYCVR